MAKQLILGRHVVSGGTTGSSTTLLPYYVGDFMQLTVQVESISSIVQTYEIQGSNADGFQLAIPATSWSTLTTIATASPGGMFTIDPGFRWVRLQAPVGASALSAFTTTFVGRT